MPLPIRMVGSLLRRKRNLSAFSLIKRLQDDAKRLEFLEPVLKTAVDLAPGPNC